jgi:hypothetical protein
MPLINLQTNLKSLKYGQDRPGGGDSGQPYVQSPIGGSPTPLSILVRNNAVRKILGDKTSNKVGDVIDKMGNFDDGFVRGGIFGSINAGITDTVRVGKFLTDAPKGPLFIARQVGLQLSNPKLEVKKVELNGKGLKSFFKDAFTGDINNLLGTLTGGLLEPTRLYNLGINTIAQVPVGALGIHFNRHGILPIQNEDSKYESVVDFNNQQNSNNKNKNWRLTSNRLLKLSRKFELGDQNYEVSRTSSILREERKKIRKENRSEKKRVKRNNQQVRKFLKNPSASAINTALGIPLPKSIKFIKDKIDLTSSNIDSYLGGPGSVYGVGFTTLHRYSYTEDKVKIEESLDNSTANAGVPLNKKDGTRNTTDPNLLLVNSGIGDSSKYDAIGTHPNVEAIDLNDVAKGIPSPQFSSYQQLYNQTIQDQSGINNAIVKDSNLKDVNVNQFGVYTSYTNESLNGNANSHYSTDVITGSIGYQNSYGDVIKLAGFKTWDAISRENRTGDFGPAKVSGSFSSSLGIKTVKDVNRADSINVTPLFYSSSGYFGNDKVRIDGIPYNIRDLVKFRIQSVNTADPKTGTWMIFRALLTSFSDNVDADWNDINYAGRGNKFYIYKGFNRKISLGFKVAALSAEEMRPMYSKLNFLIASLMPDYDNTLMRGPLHRMTVGNYLDSQLGILNSVSYTIPNDSPWEIALDEPEGGTNQLILPHILEVSMNFTPIGAETKGKNLIEAKNNFTTFLAQNNTGDVNKMQYYDSFGRI